jgi:hypothetical protein
MLFLQNILLGAVLLGNWQQHVSSGSLTLLDGALIYLVLFSAIISLATKRDFVLCRQVVRGSKVATIVAVAVGSETISVHQKLNSSNITAGERSVTLMLEPLQQPDNGRPWHWAEHGAEPSFMYPFI